MRALLYFIVFLLSIPASFGQPNSLDHSDSLYEIGIMQMKNLQIDKSYNSLNESLKLSISQGNEEQTIKSTIALAELFRTTREFEKGISLLHGINNSHRYNKLHLKKLGRLAALIHESPDWPESKKSDSMNLYLDSALSLAYKINDITEIASLSNELAFFQFRNDKSGSIESILDLFRISDSLFFKLKDTVNRINVLNHILEIQILLNEHKKVDSIINIQLALFDKRPWHSVKTKAYNLYAFHAQRVGDSLSYYKWMMKRAEAQNDFSDDINSKEMTRLRIIHESERLKIEIEKNKKLAIKQRTLIESENTKRQITTWLLVISTILLITTSLFLIQQRRMNKRVSWINKKLNKSNYDYELLVQESNHRIKNNLQMICSLLEYMKINSSDSDQETIRKISSKINTISSLHRHLSFEKHNEKVNVKDYFDEIISLYNQVDYKAPRIKINVDQINLKSERLVYLGLILNELLSNTVEHAPKSEKVKIQLIKKSNEITFSYQDGAHFDKNIKPGLGLNLIERLVSRIEGDNFKTDFSTGFFTFNLKQDV